MSSTLDDMDCMGVSKVNKQKSAVAKFCFALANLIKSILPRQKNAEAKKAELPGLSNKSNRSF